MVKVNRAALASAIYANSVDLSMPMYYRERAKESFRAADIWIDYYRSEEESKELGLELNEQVFQIMKLVKQGQKIQAIKELRARSGLGLKEAKDQVDHMERKYKHIDFERLSCDEAIEAMLQAGAATKAFKDGKI